MRRTSSPRTFGGQSLPLGSVRPGDARIGGVHHVLIDVVADVDVVGVGRSLVFPRRYGVDDVNLGVVVAIVSQNGEIERLEDGVVDFRFSPVFPSGKVLLALVGVLYPIP